MSTLLEGVFSQTDQGAKQEAEQAQASIDTIMRGEDPTWSDRWKKSDREAIAHMQSLYEKTAPLHGQKQPTGSTPSPNQAKPQAVTQEPLQLTPEEAAWKEQVLERWGKDVDVKAPAYDAGVNLVFDPANAEDDVIAMAFFSTPELHLRYQSGPDRSL